MKGVISKLIPFKSGKGYFIGLNGIDFMYFGQPSAQIGEEVDYQTGKPMKDGKPTLKSLNSLRIEEFVDEDKPRSVPISKRDVEGSLPPQNKASDYWANKEKREIEKDGVITMLSCISSACILFRSTGTTDSKPILDHAEAFYQAAIKKKAIL